MIEGNQSPKTSAVHKEGSLALVFPPWKGTQKEKTSLEGEKSIFPDQHWKEIANFPKLKEKLVPKKKESFLSRKSCHPGSDRKTVGEKDDSTSTKRFRERRATHPAFE